MKRIVSVVLTLLALSITTVSFSQILRNKQIVLITFSYTINPQIKLELDALSHLFPEVSGKKVDKVIARTKEKSWFLLQEMLEKETGVYILPLNTYGNAFNYDPYGFPDVNINRAIRVGTSKLYFRVDMTIGYIQAAKESGYGTKNPDNQNENNLGLIPQVSITITTYSDKGVIPLNKYTGTASAKEPWQINANTLSGFINDQPLKPDDTSTLLGLIHEAYKNLIAYLPK